MKSAKHFNCQLCDNQASEYHHPDYDKPFLVVPICRKCHVKIHPRVA